MFWLAWPLALVLAASVWLSYRTALQQAMLTTDHDLTASARMIAEQVRFREGQIGVIVPPAAIEIFATDAHDEVAYAVFDPKGVLIAGFPGLNPPADPGSATGATTYDTMFRTEAMHAVMLHQPVITPDGTATVTVAVGETLGARNALVWALWVRGFAAQAALVLAAAASIWIGISIELRPLMRLRRAVLDRPPRSVEPFEEDTVQQELRPLVRALNDHMARLAAYLRRQQRYLDGAAHQMRTPLAILKTQVGMARRGGAEAGSDEVLEKVDEGLTTIARVTNQLLRLGRIEHERAQLAVEEVDLRAVCRTVIGDIAPRALDCGVDLVLDADAPCLVVANGLLLREAVMNLVDNAITHAGSGAVATISAVCAGTEAVVEVADTGPGVRAAERAGLVRRFGRASRAGGGAGLGLTIVAEIVEMFGGRLDLPEPDGASGFVARITLPRHREGG
jgi:two-component system sensor histidine kinase TctE